MRGAQAGGGRSRAGVPAGQDMEMRKIGGAIHPFSAVLSRFRRGRYARFGGDVVRACRRQRQRPSSRCEQGPECASRVQEEDAGRGCREADFRDFRAILGRGEGRKPDFRAILAAYSVLRGFPAFVVRERGEIRAKRSRNEAAFEINRAWHRRYCSTRRDIRYRS